MVNRYLIIIWNSRNEQIFKRKFLVAESEPVKEIHSYFRLHGNVQRQILVYHLDGLVDIFKTESESVFEFLKSEVKLEERTLQLINLDSHIIMI